MSHLREVGFMCNTLYCER